MAYHSKKDVRITIRLEESKLKELQELAELNGKSVSEIVRMLIDHLNVIV